MNEGRFKEKLTAAMAEPAAPQSLIRKTIVRIEAVRSGAAAEAALESRGEGISAAERRSLAAQSVVGRLMQSVAPPEGVTCEMMTKQLTESPAFQKLTEVPAERLLADLRHGRINQQLAASAENRQRNQMPQAVSEPHRSSGRVR